ncbi:hypothetical protein LOK49_LG04G00763 [Camellia lanceoleosa]|uniref:Uncharacterized protein n=1 Tax=Camellia lanceoleosa TaxID=1840588 RepID=A0ACC0I2Y5_9ERIC|nr:hypothetical protein LOK49_LG04G00763 [Camellia lanceoleosa]
MNKTLYTHISVRLLFPHIYNSTQYNILQEKNPISSIPTSFYLYMFYLGQKH